MAITTNAGALSQGALVQAGMAASTLHLLKALVPLDESNDEATYLAQEADFDGYSALTLTTWENPYLDPAGGASIIPSVVCIFYFVASIGTTNLIYGYWAENTGNIVQIADNFPAAVPMLANGNAVSFTPVMNFGS